MDNNINLENLEKLKELLRKIDPNNQIFVNGNENIDSKIKELKKKEQEKQ